MTLRSCGADAGLDGLARACHKPLMFFSTGHRFILLWFVTVAIGPVVSHAQTTVAYQAADWDGEITLPPNLYRASRPIDLHGEFSVHTQPGTVLENISFQGRDKVQEWDFNGTRLQHVRIGGQLGFGAKATDCVFEDCECAKDSAWFVNYWSTHWTFDNCIVAKRFVPNTLWPVDFAVQATRCTYYGLKLPAVGLKDDPADYLQKEHLRFEKCRFIDCDVPVSFLAATVDCVFEHCRFGPKKQTKWPKEMSPVKVTAYYVGLDSELSSFTDGPVSVQFASVFKLADYGSTLQHTQSGGRITLASTPLNQHPILLGTILRKASELGGTPAATPPGYFGKPLP